MPKPREVLSHGPITVEELQETIRRDVGRKARRGIAPSWWRSGRTLAFAFTGRGDELADHERTAASEREKRGIPEGTRS
jgi:hypothetical protein